MLLRDLSFTTPPKLVVGTIFNHSSYTELPYYRQIFSGSKISGLAARLLRIKGRGLLTSFSSSMVLVQWTAVISHCQQESTHILTTCRLGECITTLINDMTK